jgi:hypothetical protein
MKFSIIWRQYRDFVEELSFELMPNIADILEDSEKTNFGK